MLIAKKSSKKAANYLRFRIILGGFLLVIVAGLVGRTVLAQSWSEPTQSPPNGNIAPPIWNQESSAQTAGFNITGNGFLAGGLGVGTTAPGTLNGVNFGSNVKFQAYNGASSAYVAVNSGTAGGYVGLLLNRSGANADQRMWVVDIQPYEGGSNSRLSFSTYSDSGNPSAKLTVLRNGRVGIGTSDPGYLLDSTETINGASASGYGVRGTGGAAATGGVYGASASASGYGLYALNSAGGYAGYFSGDVEVNGELTVGGVEVCLSDGTNCSAASVSGGGGGSDILFTTATYSSSPGDTVCENEFGLGYDNASPFDVVANWCDPPNTATAMWVKTYTGYAAYSIGGTTSNRLTLTATSGTLHMACISKSAALRRTITSYAGAPPSTACAQEFGDNYKNAEIPDVSANWKAAPDSSITLGGWIGGSYYSVSATNGNLTFTGGSSAHGAICVTKASPIVAGSPGTPESPPQLGYVWQTASAPARPWKSVTYGNGTFVAVGAAGAVATSPDGINWTIRTASSSADWRAVTYGNGLFVAVNTSNATYPVMTSTDGITWTNRTGLGDGVAWYWSSIAYGNGIFVAAVGMKGGWWSQIRVMSSPDGITWTRRTLPGILDSYTASARVGFHSSGIFTIALQIGAPRIFTSSNGTSWTQVEQTISGYTAYEQGLAYGNDTYVSVINAGSGAGMAYSADLDTWYQPLGAPYPPPSGINTDEGFVYFANGLFIANHPNQDGGGHQGLTLSIGGVNWFNATLPALSTTYWRDAVFGGSIFVAVSDDGSIIYSTP